MNRAAPTRFARRIGPGLLVLISGWGLAGWWPMLADKAPAWTRAMPLPIALAAVLTWGLLVGRRARPRQRFVMALVAAGLLAAWTRDFGGFSRSIGPIDSSTLRLTQWTLDRQVPAAEIISAVERDLPHILLLHRATAQRLNPVDVRRLRIQYAVSDRNLFVFSRFRAQLIETPTVPGARTLCVRIATPQGPLDVLALDGEGIGITRAAIDALRAWLDSRADGVPLVLVGGQELNRTDHRWTPLRRHLRPAYEIAGFGWPYSWPTPIPLFTRDHLWVSADVRVLRTAYRWSRWSRHLRQTATLALPASP